MMYNEVKSGEIPCLSFLKGTDYAMYVGPELSPKEREMLKSEGIPVPVIYLPEVLEHLSEEVVKYNFPGVDIPSYISVERIYDQIRAEFDDRITPMSRLIVKYNGDVLVIYDAKESFSLVISYLICKCKPKHQVYWSHHNALETAFSSVGDLSSVSLPNTSDRAFDAEMQKALHEAEDIIKALLLKGCPPEMILSWVNQSVKLSRMRITPQFKIFLTDYDNMEIKMGPLPKTVFLFFLRHPEGVMFSHLQDYRDELLEIYGRVCAYDDQQKMEESIDRLVDPFDNSICEKCANVKKAFILKIADNIAANYYISGAQGDKKRIPLDRSLVDWESPLR